MNRKSLLATAFVAGLLPLAATAQTSPAPPAAAAPAPVVPQAIPAKIALVAFQQAVIATNEGQRSVQEVQKKYEPRKKAIDDENTEIDSLKKQLQAAPATMPEDERASRIKSIDSKTKKLNLDAEEATNSYNEDLQKAYSVVAAKVNVVLRNYVQQNGYTLLLDVSNEQSAVMWAVPNTDVTEAVVTAYNASSGVAAPPPAAPSASRPKPAAPAAKPAAKPPTQ